MDGGDEAGGSYGLACLIDEHGESVLADLQEYYGLNLVEIWPTQPGSTYTPRMILALIRQLPPESRTIAMLRGGPEFRGWSTERYFLAGLIDAVRDGNYAFIMANMDKKDAKKVPPPEPVPIPDRPAKKPRPKHKTNFAAMAAKQLEAARRRAANPKGE